MSKKKMYNRLQHGLHKLYPYAFKVPTPQRAELTVDLGENNTATIHLGDKCFHIHSFIDTPLTHANYDFALYGAAVIALSHNIEIYTDLPISKSCNESIQKLYRVMRTLKPAKIYVQPITLTNIVDDPSIDPEKPGLMCMSGGVDSTFSAVQVPKASSYTHSMLVAGGDYPDAQSTGFRELSTRVNEIGKTTGMTLIEVETSIRKYKVNWGMLHCPCLLMCLLFHSSTFGKGVISADYIPIQEIVSGAWGNSSPVIQSLSTPNFPIEHFGSSTFRYDKINKIHQTHPQLIKNLSVCYTNKKVGGNCGECIKCIRTMLDYYSLGIDYKQHFLTERDLATLIKTLPVASLSETMRRVMLANYLEEEHRLPEGKIKEAVNRYITEIENSLIPHGI